MSRNLLQAVTSLAAMGFAAWLVFPRPSETAPAQAAPRELERAELKLVEGRLHRVGETNAFTGLFLDRYPTGTLRSRARVLDGRLEGLCEGWSTNGALEVSEHFRDGVSHGLRTKWYPNGVRRSEATIEHGRIHGRFQRWHEDGSLAESMSMVDGVPHGISRAYHPGGALKAEIILDQGKVVEPGLAAAAEAAPRSTGRAL
ncbi:MAG: toxin-antitoxin system YwqK family antitoxin [Verrucomicrobiales bacterium]|nr:toxin-antitoxin system YwqK family antitoxin [Verrucomicrobiales bacterium]